MGWRNYLRNNTKLEKILIFFVVLLCGVVLVLFITLLSSAHESGICDSPQCVKAATHILDTVDPAADPCHDFYNFACGTFLKNAFSLGQPTPLHSLQILTKNQLKEIVIETNDRRNTSRALAMQRKFYRTCINETSIEEDNDTTFMNVLDKVVGGWPLVKSYFWVERDFDWIKTMVKARRFGLFYQFFFRVGIYFGNESNSAIIWIKPPTEKDVWSFHWRHQNLELMSQIASDFGAQSVGRMTELRRTLDFAEQLNLKIENYFNNTRKTDVKSRSKNVTIKNLDHGFIKIDWLEFLQNITGIALREDDEVLFDADEYFQDLYYLLQRTPRKIQANYIAWSIISSNAHYMTKKIRNKFKKMRNSFNDTDSTSSRDDLCYKISISLFKHVAEAEYVRRYTPPSKREYIRDIITNIKIELQSMLEQLTWMDDHTKSHAVQHLKNITEDIGWTELVYDAKKFERLFGYHQLKMTSDKLIDMDRSVAVNTVNFYYRQLNQSGLEEEEEYLNSPKLDVNAFYLKYFNKLILPSPILQGLVFDERRPHYMNYGSLGSVIGHEFMHGILDLFGSDGEMFKDTWWTKTTVENFKSSSQCIVDEYNMYSNRTTSNNNTVFEENLADFASVNLAYTAYKKWTRKNSLEERLPGIKYTPNQLFWIMTSTYLCYEPKVSEKDEPKKKDPIHAVASYRVKGRLQNSPHFAKDFGCAAGTPMNPEKKCRIFT